MRPEALFDFLLLEKHQAGWISDLVNDEAQAQRVARAIERRRLEFLVRSVPAVRILPPLCVPDDGPALAGVRICCRKMAPAERRFCRSWPLT